MLIATKDALWQCSTRPFGHHRVAVGPMRGTHRVLHARCMITTAALAKSEMHVPPVRDVSWHCDQGTFTGFLGANGTGKSTTVKIAATPCVAF
jgi:ABC-type polysaccharide/polyol phosphate transport system ATPase subunit